MGQQRARSLRAQLRTGTAPLAAIESRHHQGPESTRPSPLCIHCDLAAVDDQAHVLCVCPLHEDDRTRLFDFIDTEWRRAAAAARYSRASPPWWYHAIDQFDCGWSSMNHLQRAQWMLQYDGTIEHASIARQVDSFIYRSFARRRNGCDSRRRSDTDADTASAECERSTASAT